MASVTVFLLALSLLLPGVPARCAESAEGGGPGPDAFRGGWCGVARYGEQTANLALHVASEGAPIVTADLPTMDTWGARIGELKVADGAVQIGPWSLAVSAGEDAKPRRLTGYLPSWLVPAQTLPVEFERCEPPARAVVEWNHPRPEIAWTVDAGAPVWAGLEFDRAANRLLVATRDGYLLALDAATGDRAWWWNKAGSIHARPSIVGDAIYVASDDGKVSKLERLSGKLIWQADIGTGPERLGPENPESKWDRYGSSVVAAGNRLFVGSRDGAVYCLDAQTGERKWRFQTDDIVQATPALAGNRVFVASFDGRVTALAAATGEPLWRHATGFPIPADLAVAGDVVLAGSRSYELLALAVGNGDPVWKRYFWFSWIDSSPNVEGGVAYIGSSDGLKLSALNAQTGDALWETRVPGWSWARPSVTATGVFEGTVGTTNYIGGRTGTFFAADRSTGEIRWLYEEAPPEEGQYGFAASSVATDELVYAADLGGRIYAFRTAPPDEHSSVGPRDRDGP
jgi:outer membrane protein assembly factor BamB